MAGIYGEYKVTMDAKGRMILPADFCKQLPAEDKLRFHIKTSKEGCLALYTNSQWAIIEAELEKLNPLKSSAMRYKRSFLDGYRSIEVDSANRILIPKPLQEMAGLTKEIVFWSLGSQVEIWDLVRKEEYVAAAREDEEGLADELFN